ncbi:MAG: electron transfer flavoprotein subunit alpha/FixB family protein [Candidatus Methanomethylicia archaeon]
MIVTYSNSRECILELISKSRNIANTLGLKIASIVMGLNVSDLANSLSAYSDIVYIVDNPILKHATPDVQSSVLHSILENVKPELILLGGLKEDKEIAARLSAKMNTGCVSECIDIEVEKQSRRILFKRLVYGGIAIAIESINSKPQVASVRKGVFEKASPLAVKGEVIKLDVSIPKPRLELIEVKGKEVKGVDFESAEVVIVGGRGVRRREDFKLLEELKEVLNGVVGCTRPVAADLKWFTEWIGLSGHMVKPKLYIGIGVSGAIQHIAGIKDSKIVVAVNNDPNAPIFNACDYGIVGDLYEVLPELIKEIKILKTHS